MTDPTLRPLTGTTVVDMGQVLATPFATHLLAMLGAEVIKVEPHHGEFMRSGNPRAFAAQNAQKLSLAIDMRAQGADDVVLRLCEQADVFVEGFAPGTAEAMGVGWDAVHQRNPALVYGSLSAFGTTGPYGGRPGFDHVVQAIGGTMWSTGFEGDPPIKVGAPYLDYGTGLLLGFGLLAGLLQARATGEGVRVDAAMLDTALLLNLAAVVNTTATGKPPQRTGNDAFSGAIASGAFECSDGWLMLAANKASHTQALAELLGVEPFVAGDVAGTRAVLSEHFASDTAKNWEERLNNAKVPAARIRDLAEVTSEGHIEARGLLSPVDMPDGDTWLLPGAGVALNGTMNGPTAPPPAVGEHSVDVLGRFGFAPEEISQLIAAGTVATRSDDAAT